MYFKKLQFRGFVIFSRQLSQSLCAVTVEAQTMVILGGSRSYFIVANFSPVKTLLLLARRKRKALSG